jgi:hypothetical protein
MGLIGLTGPGSLTHALVVPPKSWQIHPSRQGLVALQVPVQAGNSLGFLFCSCRVETLPAHRMAVIKIASDSFFTAFNDHSLSERENRTLSRYFNTVAPGMGCDEQNVLPVSIRTTQMQPVLQGLVALQPPPQVANPVASIRSCRAETVPAQRTAAAIAVKTMFLIVLRMVRPPCSNKLEAEKDA